MSVTITPQIAVALHDLTVKSEPVIMNLATQKILPPNRCCIRFTVLSSNHISSAHAQVAEAMRVIAEQFFPVPPAPQKRYIYQFFYTSTNSRVGCTGMSVDYPLQGYEERIEQGITAGIRKSLFKTRNEWIFDPAFTSAQEEVAEALLT